MKKLAIIAAIAAFAIPALLQLIHGVATDNPIVYFSEDPSRLLWVAAIAITGGLVTWGVSQAATSGTGARANA